MLECEEAKASGYTTFKTKARPWWDLVDQAERLCEAVPPHFKLDFDFNDFGLDRSVAKRLCLSMEHLPQIAIWESPIRQDDVAGVRHLRSHVSVSIAHPPTGRSLPSSCGRTCATASSTAGACRK